MKEQIASEMGLSTRQVESTLTLLDDSNTVPFIARYRKEQTGGLDEVQIRAISEQAESIRKLNNRRETILKTIKEQGELSEDLRNQIKNTTTQSKLEDLYAPYRPRQRTRATQAKEAGLKPVAKTIKKGKDPSVIADNYTSEEYPDIEEVLQGARDILAEEMSDNPKVRGFLRKKAYEEGRLTCSKRRGAEGEEKYQNYYNFSVPIDKVEPHQILAIRRGENKKELSASLKLKKNSIKKRIANHLIETDGVSAQHHYEAIKDGYDRLLHPAIEREIRTKLEDQADDHAIKNFSLNLKNLLLQPPMPNTMILGIDPGQRTGCKLAVIGTNGELLGIDQCYVHDERRDIAVEIVGELVNEFNADLVAIGNGTASRNTENVVGKALKDNDDVQYAIVDEAGASVYSASKIARDEFPELDVSYRGAVSIARRLQDPLAELVKIDPQSIGVGMYQHDVNQNDLEDALNAVIEDVVNSVGVDLNSASSPLLSRVAGIGPTLAERIVDYRENHGSFSTRKQLKTVKGMGTKTYQQCAGFLRIRDGEDSLDNTGIHPENYDITRYILNNIECEPGDPDLSSKLKIFRNSDDFDKLCSKHEVGEMTLSDILDALQTPGRDPRNQLDPPDLRTDVLSFEDLEVGMELLGTVRNVVDFGAFVDIGVKNDGLLHVSELADRYVDNPHEEVSIGDKIKVSVKSMDRDNKKISLTVSDS